jgi:hypothetical protein
MKRSLILPLLLFTGSGLSAQDPHLGFGLNLVFPTGDFRTKSYAQVPNSTDPNDAAQTESHDVGLGAQITISFPIEQAIAFRLNFSGQVTNGTNTAYLPSGTDIINLQHSIYSIGGDLQIFVNGSASRHRGTYFLGGLAADFERFDSSYGDFDSDYSHEDVATRRKSRLGGNFGLGHSFGFAGTRFTLEATFHKTLSGNDAAKAEPPNSDFTRLSLGWVF